MHPIQKLGDIISEFPNTLLLVDGITAVGAMPLPMDQWKIDGLVAGSQKAFMLPAGLSFVAFSKKAQGFFENSLTPRYYLDLRKEKTANARGETFFSSSVTLIRALDVALDIMLKTSLQDWHREIQRRADFVHHIAKALNLKAFSRAPSPSVTALECPEGIDGQKWRAHLESQYNLTVMGGQDQLKGKVIRIGHMGYITKEDLVALAQALFLSLRDFDFKLPLHENDFELLTRRALDS